MQSEVLNDKLHTNMRVNSPMLILIVLSICYSILSTWSSSLLNLKFEGDQKVREMIHHSFLRQNTRVSCGNHDSTSCAECPQGHGKPWCNGDCRWDDVKDICELTPKNEAINCGSHKSASCAQCPQGQGEAFCNGDCVWNDLERKCVDRPKLNCGAHFTFSCSECPLEGGKTWCNGDCHWDDMWEECVEKDVLKVDKCSTGQASLGRSVYSASDEPNLVKHNSSTPSIAFLFMTTHQLNEELWRQWFPKDDDRYSIFVHTIPSNTTIPLGPFFCQFAVPSAAAVWGELHNAMMKVLRYAFDHDTSASHFIFVSATSVPLVSFDDMYDTLMQDGGKSRLCWFDQLQAVNAWAPMADTVGIDLNVVRKAEMWSELSREHVEIVLNHQSTMSVWNKHLKRPWTDGAPDELFIPTVLNQNVGPLQFQNCSAIGPSGLNTCCPTAVFWGNNIARVKEKENISIPLSLVTDEYEGGSYGAPVTFLSLHEKGLKALQDQGFLFLRKVKAKTKVKNSVNQILELNDALFQLHSKKPMVPGSNNWKIQRRDYCFQCAAP